MSEDKKETPTESPAPIAEIEHGPGKFEQFLDAHQKKLIIIGILLIVGIGAYVVWDEMGKAHQAKAAAAFSSAKDLPALREVVEKFPDTPAAGAATISIAQRQWDDAQQSEAITTLKDFISANEKHAHLGTALSTLASYQHELGNLEEAKANYAKVAEREDSRFLAPHALTSLGDIALREGDKEKARSYYEQASADEFKGIAPTNLTQMRLEVLDLDRPTVKDPPKKEEPKTPTPGLPGSAPAALPGAAPAALPNTPPATLPTAPAKPDPTTPTTPTTPAPPEKPAQPAPPANSPSPAQPETPKTPAPAGE